MMAVVARKYNPGFLSDDELVATFCVRTNELASLVETLRDCSGSANTHQIVIGPRGSGKTSLLLRVAVEIRRDERLSSSFFPIVFAEESYEVSSVGEFWLECLSRLADQAPDCEDGTDLHDTFEELKSILDDKTLGDRCLGALQDFSDRECKRLVLFVENLNMMFTDIGDKDSGWRLRHTLQTDYRIVLVASATSRFEEIDNPKRALYDLFRVTTLRPLSTEDCEELWETISSRDCASGTIRALQILSGGNPRLLTILARFGGHLSFRHLMTDLLDLIDDHTEYFRSHLDALAAQERRVYLALADLWQPATAREVANRARLDTSKCSAHLARLTDRGAVEVSGGSPRRRLYYLTERLYNIYYLMRRARGPVPLVEALIRFMEAYYSPEELMEFGVRMAREAAGLDARERTIFKSTINRLLQVPSLEQHREELLGQLPTAATVTPRRFGFAPSTSSAATKLSRKAIEMAESGRLDEALASWNEVVLQFGSNEEKADVNQVGHALINKGKALSQLGRVEEALAAWNGVVERFGTHGGTSHPKAAAIALLCKGSMLGDLGRHSEVLITVDEFMQRFGASQIRDLNDLVNEAHLISAFALLALNHPKEALESFDEVQTRCDQEVVPDSRASLASALVGRGHALAALDQLVAAIEVWRGVVERFGEAESPLQLGFAAEALTNMGTAFFRLGRMEEALGAFETVVDLYAKSESRVLVQAVALSQINRGHLLIALKRESEAVTCWQDAFHRIRTFQSRVGFEPIARMMSDMAQALYRLGQIDDALDMWDEVAERLSASDLPKLRTIAADALKNKGVLLEQLGQLEEALAVWERVEFCFSTQDQQEIVQFVAGSLLHRVGCLLELGRLQEALKYCDQIVVRFGLNDDPEIQSSVAGALANKGIILIRLDENEEAINACVEVEEKFGSIETLPMMKQVAKALASRGTALLKLNRPVEAIDVFIRVEEEFGSGNDEVFFEDVAIALLNQGVSLLRLNRLDEAIEVYDEAIERFQDIRDLPVLTSVVKILVNKGTTLMGLKKVEEAIAVWNDVIQRFGDNGQPELRNTAALALYYVAKHELNCGHTSVAVDLLNRQLLDEIADTSEVRLHVQILRARADLAEGNPAACNQDLELMLKLLPHSAFLTSDIVSELIELAAIMGARPLSDLIKSSPSADHLLPLTTALERDLGLEPRVAREVNEIADDILRELESVPKLYELCYRELDRIV